MFVDAASLIAQRFIAVEGSLPTIFNNRVNSLLTNCKVVGRVHDFLAVRGRLLNYGVYALRPRENEFYGLMFLISEPSIDAGLHRAAPGIQLPPKAEQHTHI